jgi:hypothetical protein
MLTIAADPKYLGARIGATTVLHSWGSTMTHHPHVHMIVPGGGISLDGTIPALPGAEREAEGVAHLLHAPVLSVELAPLHLYDEFGTSRPGLAV